MRSVVIGCGSIGTRHIANLLALGAGEGLANDLEPERCRQVITRFGIEAVETLGQAWERGVSVAFITTPTSLHTPVAVEAARHGCHLFIDKPLADRRDGLDQLLELVDERRLVTLVGCNMRFQPGLRKVKELIDDGAIGRVMAARIEAGQYLPDWHPWEDYRRGYSARRDLGGGVILDAIHEIDYARWMLGEVRAVSCFAAKLSQLEIDTEDTAAILLRFASGAIGELHLDYVQRAYSRSCQLIGERGTIRWDWTSGVTRCYTAGCGREDVFDYAGWDLNQMYIDELRHFLRCLRGEEKPSQDVFEGARVLAVALAAKASAASGRVVELDGVLAGPAPS